MPVVPYYQGRPASTWITAMSGPARAATANPAGGTSPASRQPGTPAAQRRAPAGTSARAAASASAWEAWAANWFARPGRPVDFDGKPGSHWPRYRDSDSGCMPGRYEATGDDDRTAGAVRSFPGR